MVLYMCSRNDEYEFPICVSETSAEIDRIMGFCEGYTLSNISRQKSGAITEEKSKYKLERIEIDDDFEFATTTTCAFCGKEFKYFPHPGAKPRIFCDEHSNKKYAARLAYQRKKEKMKEKQ